MDDTKKEEKQEFQSPPDPLDTQYWFLLLLRQKWENDDVLGIIMLNNMFDLSVCIRNDVIKCASLWSATKAVEIRF